MSFLNLDPNLAKFYQNMSLVKEMEYNNYNPDYYYDYIPYYCWSTFTYSLLSNNSVKYYVNDMYGVSIYDQDWNYIDRKHANMDYGCGQMFVVGDFIYIGTNLLHKLDLNFKVIRRVSFRVTCSMSHSYDSCNKRILSLGYCPNFNKLYIHIYNLNLRKISEMNTSSIANYISNGQVVPYSILLSYYNNQIFISYQNNSFPYELYMLVADSNCQLIGIYKLQNSSPEVGYRVAYTSMFTRWRWSFINDRFGNILYVNQNQICLFNLTTYITTGCTEAYPISMYDIWWYTYLNMDQSGRLVLLNARSNKILFFF